jgi:glycosyltransferase involved in cell wall biosynthesis
MTEKSKSILIVGPRLGDPEKAGGMLVYFENILKDLDDLNINYKVVNTNSQIYKNVPHMFLVVILNFLKDFLKYDHINFHSTFNQIIVLGPFFVFFAKLFGKEISIKKIAGTFDWEYKKLDPFRQWLIRYTLKNADIMYFETKYLVDHFKHFNKRTYWHPNIRRNPNLPYQDRRYNKKFAFISLVRKEKGMDELLEVSNKLDDSFTIDIYGPIFTKKYTDEYFKDYKANYLGSLAPQKVLEKLKEYDVIVLPSYQEGYPGIFIEAFSFGVPILTTTLAPIMEIVKHQENGILVEPKNVDALEEGFLSFNNENYQVMSKNAYASFDLFDSFKQTQKMFNDINSI